MAKYEKQRHRDTPTAKTNDNKNDKKIIKKTIPVMPPGEKTEKKNDSPFKGKS